MKPTIVIDVDVSYTIHEAERGQREHGVPIDPDIPAYVEIRTVKIGDIDITAELDESQIESLKEDVMAAETE